MCDQQVLFVDTWFYKNLGNILAICNFTLQISRWVSYWAQINLFLSSHHRLPRHFSLLCARQHLWYSKQPLRHSKNICYETVLHISLPMANEDHVFFFGHYCVGLSGSMPGCKSLRFQCKLKISPPQAAHSGIYETFTYQTVKLLCLWVRSKPRENLKQLPHPVYLLHLLLFFPSCFLFIPLALGR